MTSLLVKESVNQATDLMGFTNALHAAFSLHQMNHGHWLTLTNGEHWLAQPEHGVPRWRDAPPVRCARKDHPGD